ncbi:hypothetical protein LSUE1_G006645, partial [Lachnellula suecica]
MRRIADTFLRRWHKMLGLQHQSPPWYRARLQEEQQEVLEAKTYTEKLSETSDVYFTIIRAKYDGFPIEDLQPFVATRDTPIYAYMLGKYTLRWGFYRTASWLCGAPRYWEVSEVVNPTKGWKLRVVAARHLMDPVEFEKVGTRLRWIWPLL